MRKISNFAPLHAPKIVTCWWMIYSSIHLHHGWRKFWDFIPLEALRMTYLGWIHFHRGWRIFWNFIPLDALKAKFKAQNLLEQGVAVRIFHTLKRWTHSSPTAWTVRVLGKYFPHETIWWILISDVRVSGKIWRFPTYAFTTWRTGNES